MSNGFQKEDSAAIEVIKRRLEPAVRREDDAALAVGMRKMVDRYGGDVVIDAVTGMFEDYPWLCNHCISMLPPDQKRLFNDEAIAIMIDILEDAGLRLEDHIRVSDKGFIVTKLAASALSFSEAGIEHPGYDSISGMGISRSPFCHPLGEVTEHEGEPFLNNWAAVAAFINAAQGWFGEPGNPERAKSVLGDFVSRVAPTVDLELMLHRSRYDDRVLMQLASYAAQGFDAIARQQAGQ